MRKKLNSSAFKEVSMYHVSELLWKSRTTLLLRRVRLSINKFSSGESWVHQLSK